jgi:hypothetical protein
MSEIAQKAWNEVKEAWPTLGLGVAIVAANLVDTERMTVYADDPLSRQAVLALPSALPAPEVTGNNALDIAIQVGTAAISCEAIRRTSNVRHIAATALSAQVVACAANAVAERSGWLTAAERTQPDVGFSSISIAWATEFLLDRADKADTPLQKGLWRTGTAVLAGTMSVGSYVAEGGQGGSKLEMVAHGSAAAVGFIAHLLGKRRASS